MAMIEKPPWKCTIFQSPGNKKWKIELYKHDTFVEVFPLSCGFDSEKEAIAFAKNLLGDKKKCSR